MGLLLRALHLGCVGALICLPARGDDDRGWLGIYTEPARTLPEIEAAAGGSAALQGATGGMLVTAVFPDSPADEGGLLVGDILISLFGKPFTCHADSLRAVFRRALDDRQVGTPCPVRVIRNAVRRELILGDTPAPTPLAQRFWRNARAALDSLDSGDSLRAFAAKQQEVRDLPIVLGLRPEARWPAPRANDEIYPPERFPAGTLGDLVWALADQESVRTDTQDLLQRLDRCHSGSDPFRLECMTYVHRDPLRIEAVSRHIVAEAAAGATARDAITRLAPLLVPEYSPCMPLTRRLRVPAPDAGAPTREARIRPLLDQIRGVLSEAQAWHTRAFAALSDADRRFLEGERWNLSDIFAEEIYIHFDEDQERFAKNKRILDLAARVDYAALIESALRLALLSDIDWARAAAGQVSAVYADTLAAEVLLQQATPWGQIILGGTARHWYRDCDAAFILDLGGDDFYSGNNGGSASWSVPLAVCIDLAGNDAYESTLKSCQGAGCLGSGGLLDLAGDDQYIGLQWCQGSGYFGVGWLHDLGGDDTYRGRTFCQAVGLFGIGLLIDERGADRYEGDCHVQGVGLAKGIGALIERAGDDQFYAKGLYPTGYGDAGIFDAWSQGCGMGFRTLASGGLGLLLDLGGRDRLEAGNFSQGGGYYYGFGICQSRGAEDDVYIGSRYNQGFCAHQALGVFFEEGGDDFYTTRQAVAQGLAWDECVTLFIDERGNDTYQGGGGFSQGASAHNSFCFFLDRAGRDTYDYRPGQARAGGNSYHGGTSFSLFIDEGGARDRYNAAGAANNTWDAWPEHGFFLDLRGSHGQWRPGGTRR